MPSCVILPMDVSHLPQVANLEKMCFSDPWSLSMFEEELRLTQAHYFVMMLQGTVIGYGGFWLVLDEETIMNIAVHPDYRGKGYGAALLQKLLEEAEKGGACDHYLEVRVSNKAAISLYEKFGFRALGVRKGYYQNNHEDALVMKYSSRQ